MNDLKQIMAEAFGIEESSITDETNKENTKEWDSFSHILLISLIEDKYGFSFSIEDTERIDSYNDIVYMLKKYLKN